MPRRKSDYVHTIRIEAGRWEREKLLKPVADIAGTANMIRSVGMAAGGVALVGGAYALYWLVDALYDAFKNAPDGIFDTKTGELITALLVPWKTPQTIKKWLDEMTTDDNANSYTPTYSGESTYGRENPEWQLEAMKEKYPDIDWDAEMIYTPVDDPNNPFNAPPEYL